MVRIIVLVALCAHAALSEHHYGGHHPEHHGGHHYAPAHHVAPYAAHSHYAPVPYHAAATYEPVYPPQAYSFGYKIDDGYHNNQFHQEEGDNYGAKKGSYGFTDAHGVYRKVDYIADEHGFRATIHTNEPGTADSHPANAKIVAAPAKVVLAPAAHHYAPIYAYSPFYHRSGKVAERPYY